VVGWSGVGTGTGTGVGTGVDAACAAAASRHSIAAQELSETMSRCGRPWRGGKRHRVRRQPPSGGGNHQRRGGDR